MGKKIQLSISSLIISVLVLGGVAGTGGYFWARHQDLAAGGLNTAQLNEVYSLLKQKYDGTLSDSQLNDGAKAGLAEATGDPYTVFMTADQYKQLNDDLNGTLSGIGAEVGIKNQKLVVIAPIDGAPAQKAGLRAGDQIVKIDGADPSNMTLDQAVQKIRGPKGTQVKLTIVRGNGAPFDVTITRDNITVPSVKWEMKPGNIGYISISTFGSDTADKMNQAVSQLKGQGAKSIILDLRNDPGGLVTAAISVASHWLPSNDMVVQMRRGSQVEQTYNSYGTDDLAGIKTIVLINGGSASASEIVSSALHDNHAATLVGETSFGKGSEQEIDPLAGGAVLKVTIAHWYTPDGKNINKQGITPDVAVPLSQSDYDAGRDPQLDKALQLAAQ